MAGLTAEIARRKRDRAARIAAAAAERGVPQDDDAAARAVAARRSPRLGAGGRPSRWEAMGEPERMAVVAARLAGGETPEAIARAVGVPTAAVADVIARLSEDGPEAIRAGAGDAPAAGWDGMTAAAKRAAVCAAAAEGLSDAAIAARLDAPSRQAVRSVRVRAARRAEREDAMADQTAGDGGAHPKEIEALVAAGARIDREAVTGTIARAPATVAVVVPGGEQVAGPRAYAARCWRDALARGETPVPASALYDALASRIDPEDRAALGAGKLAVYEDGGLDLAAKNVVIAAVRAGIAVEFRRVAAGEAPA